jgi:hypothetical protein
MAFKQDGPPWVPTARLRWVWVRTIGPPERVLQQEWSRYTRDAVEHEWRDVETVRDPKREGYTETG